MVHANLFQSLDNKALHLSDQNRSQDVYEFDWTLWNLVHRLANEAPDDTAAHFALPKSTVAVIGAASSDRLARLASGVLISFALETKESVVLEMLSEPYDPVVFLNRRIDDFDASYWLLMSKMALREPAFAQECFGVSSQLVNAAANASDSQLRDIASRTVTHFSVRFTGDVIEEILLAENPTYPILKKIQQTLARRKQS